MTQRYVAAKVDAGGRFVVENLTGASEAPATAGTLRVQTAGGTLADLFGAISPPTMAATATDSGVISAAINRPARGTCPAVP